MKIDLRDKKIVIPIIIFIGLVLLVVFLYKEDDNTAVIEDNPELISDVGDVSKRESERPVDNKFDAYDNAVREQRNKYTAIEEIEFAQQNDFSDDYVYSEEEIRRFEEEKQRKARENITQANRGYVAPPTSSTLSDEEEYRALMRTLNEQQKQREQPQFSSSNNNETPSAYDEMRKQYLFLDSLQKASDPDLIAKADQEERDRKILEAIEQKKLSTLKVGKISNNEYFNTVTREDNGEFIKAIIDESITGYAGSRLRIRLLEDIRIGNKLLKKNNYLYAIITGFGDQRVRLNIVSVMYENSILPINLSIYDIDGLEGLYVPASQFREFSKELGGSTVQGVSTNSTQSENQFFTSIMQRVFQSTSEAVAKLIRKNRVKVKYNSHIYLIDEAALQESKNSIYEQNKNNN